MREYMTDEELEKFLDEIENEQIQAPFYLKKEILDAAFNEKDNKIEVDFSKMNARNKNNKKGFALYTLKVCASIAAVIALLIFIPESLDNSSAKTKEVNATIEQNMEKVSNGISDAFDNISNNTFKGYLRSDDSEK